MCTNVRLNFYSFLFCFLVHIFVSDTRLFLPQIYFATHIAVLRNYLVYPKLTFSVPSIYCSLDEQTPASILSICQLVWYYLSIKCLNSWFFLFFFLGFQANVEVAASPHLYYSSGTDCTISEEQVECCFGYFWLSCSHCDVSLQNSLLPC